jgi:hypothetical protein
VAEQAASNLKVFSGMANELLARAICKYTALFQDNPCLKDFFVRSG